MSIALAQKQKDLEARIARLEELLKTNSLQSKIDGLKCRIEALESRPRPGRPPKDDNGRHPTN